VKGDASISTWSAGLCEGIWVVLPSDNEDLLLLRPLSGTDDEIGGIYLPLKGKELQEARFPAIDPKATASFAEFGCSCR
jgi:hypothetical protein